VKDYAHVVKHVFLREACYDMSEMGVIHHVGCWRWGKACYIFICGLNIQSARSIEGGDSPIIMVTLMVGSIGGHVTIL
jgi:hypothetical protein